jgi:DNA polymerase
MDIDEGEELDALARGVRAQLLRLADRRVAWVPAAPPPAAAEVATGAPAAALARPSGEAPAAGRAPVDLSGAAARLAQIREELGECTRCKLHPTRKTIVFGVGNPGAELMFVGEGPGANEDTQGEPFVGDAGQLLNRMIAAMGYGREEVYIANTVKCRPPGNRNPEPDELETCEPFLKQQIAAIKPRVIVALDKFAAPAHNLGHLRLVQ